MEERSTSKRSKSRHGASSAKDGTFASLGLEPRLLRALNNLGFKQPTPVQSRCIPVALEGRDLIALAPTGSGKTLGYLLPTLHRVLTSASGPGPSWQALVLVPTRELCEQVAGVAAQVCRAAGDAVRATPLTAATSESMMAELGEVVVTTPARLLAALGADPALERALQTRLTTLVVDEADLLMAYGHDRDLAAIAPRIPRAAQSMLFSATSSPEVEAAEKLVLHSPARLDVRDAGKAGGARGGEGPMAGTAASIAHHVLRLPRSCAERESRSMCERMLHLLVLLQHGLLPKRTLVFVNGVDDAVRLRLFFGAFGLRAAAVHSQLPLNSRSHILQEFNAGLIQILVATDGAGKAAQADRGRDAKDEHRIEREAHAEARAEGGKARGRKGAKAGTPGEEFGVTRGIDFKGVSSVVNLTVPPAIDSYVHRVGRTGRGGETGMAITLVGPGDADFEVALERCLALAQPAGAEAAQKADAASAAAPLAKPSNFGVLGLQRFEALPQKSIKALRYRAEDVFRSLTSSVVREARVQELKQEMLNSERLASFFEEHPQDLQLLKHDRPLVSTKASAASAKHVKHVPAYMADSVGTAGARTQAAALAYRAAKRPRAGSVDPLKKLTKKVARIRDKPTEMELKADAYGKKVAQKKAREEAKNRRLVQQHAERNKRTKK